MQARGSGSFGVGGESLAACDYAPILAPLRLESPIEGILRRIVTNLPIGVLRGGNDAVQVGHLLQNRCPLTRTAAAQIGYVSGREVRGEIIEVAQRLRARQQADADLRRRVVDGTQT